MLPFLVLLLSIVLPSLAASANDWSCPVISNATFVPDISLAEAQYGSSSYIHGNLVQPWPVFKTRSGLSLRGPRYCFDSKETREMLTCKGNFWKALALWREAVGHPNELNGNSLAWQETTNGALDARQLKPEYCYVDMRQQHPDMPLEWNWNPKVPDDTLIISTIAESRRSHATVGYKGINKGVHPHEMVVGEHASIAVIAHELGHVWGMAHEHTRNDRDDHVRYDCQTLSGYDDALSKATSKGVPLDEAKRRLCDDADFARDNGLPSAVAFLKNDMLHDEPSRWGALDDPGGYDIESIMHYASYTFGDLQKCYVDQSKCPLLEIVKDTEGTEVGLRRIPQPVRPSKGDVAWVKRNYCWPADETCRVG